MGIKRIPFIIEPSFNAGYAETKESCAYPTLWDDLSWAAYQNMGPSIELYDFSGKRNYAALPSVYGTPLFARSKGQWGYEHDSVGDTVYLPGFIDDLVALENVSFVLGYEKSDSTDRNASLFGSSSLTAAEYCGVMRWSSGQIDWEFGGVASGAGSINTTAHGSGDPTMGDDCWVFTTGNRGMEIWQNGKRIAYDSAANRIRQADATKTLRLGAGHDARQSDLAYYKYFLVYNRQLSFDEIDLLSHEPKALLIPKPFIARGGPVIFDKSLSHNLSLSHIGESNTQRRQVQNTLELLQNVIYANLIGDRQVPENFLGLTDAVFSGSNPFMSHDLGLDDSLSYIGPRPVSASNSLNLGSWVSHCFSAPWSPIEVSHNLGLSHIANVPYEISIEDPITFHSWVERLFPTESILGLVQIVDAGVWHGITQTLGITDTINSEYTLNRGVAHTDFLQDAFTYYIDNGCNRKQYTRFEGSGPSQGISEEPLIFDANFALETLSGTKEILYLRSPETDDKHRMGFSRINRESRGGELQVYQDPSWPIVHTLLFTITALSDSSKGCPDKINDLIDFLQEQLGKEIMLHDWEGLSWKGVITTPNETAVEDQAGWWTISFEFQGEQLDGSQGDQTLSIIDAVSVNGDYGRALSDDLGLSQAIGVSGILAANVEQSLGISGSLLGSYSEHFTLEDDFSGGAGTDLHGQSPDKGASTWSAHTNYKADGSQTAINSGAYYPIAPVSGNHYYIEWGARSLAESAGLETTFFLGEGLNSNPDDIGPTAYGAHDPTTLKAGFVLRDIGGTQLNACRLGDSIDGAVDTVDFTDGTLKALDNDIDLRLLLDTTGGAGRWEATWYAKTTGASDYTEVRATTRLVDENITTVGWANNNTTTTVELSGVSITTREML